MSYFDLFLDAISIVWRYKFLWLFGILSALNIADLSNVQAGPGIESTGSGGYAFMEVYAHDLNLWRIAYDTYGSRVLFALGVTLLIGLAVVIASLVVQASLITSVSRAINNEEIDWRASLRSGTHIVKPFATVMLLLYGPYWVVALFLSQALVATNLTGTPFWIAALVFYPAGVILTAINWFAQRGIAIREFTVRQGIANGWQFLCQHLRKLIIIGIILSVISIAYGAVVNAILHQISDQTDALPTIFGWLEVGLPMSQVLSVIGVSLLALLLSAPLSAYQSIVFTLAYSRLDGGGQNQKRNRR